MKVGVRFAKGCFAAPMSVIMLSMMACQTESNAVFEGTPRHIDPLCTDACTSIVASGCSGEEERCEDRCQADLDEHPLCPETFHVLYACCADSTTNQCVVGGWSGIDYTCGEDCDAEEGDVILCANSDRCDTVPTADAHCGTSLEYCDCSEFTMSCLLDLATSAYPVPSVATTCRELSTRAGIRDYCCLRQ